MGLEFYLSTSGSDNNGGSSAAVIVSGSSASVTQSDATVDLSGDTPDLSGVNQGAFNDTIRIAGRTDGLNGTDIFEITAVDDGADTVEVSPTPTDTSQGGLTWAIGGAWSTPQKAMDVVSAGDKVWMKADGDYVDDSDADDICAEIRTNGTATSPITFEGYKTTPGDADDNPDDDTYRATINGTPNSLASGIAVDAGVTGTSVFYVFKNTLVKNCSAMGINLGAKGNVTFVNCRSTANQMGLFSGVLCFCLGCSFDNNTVYGMISSGEFIACKVFGNALNGLLAGGKCRVLFCRFYDNGGDGFGTNATASHVLMNNTFDGGGQPAGKAAISIGSNSPSMIIGNIIHDFDIGLKALDDQGERMIVRNNLFTNVNTLRQNIPVGLGDIEAADPGFVDEANNDYRLRFGSPARGAGLPSHVDIGARQRKELPTHGPTNVGVQV